MKIEIPLKLPSLNEIISANRSNKYAGANKKKQIETAIMWYLKPVKEKITEPVVIHFTWYEKTKKRDKDNVASSKKLILDALQKSGILPNDNNNYIAGFTDNFVYGDGDKVVIEIEVKQNKLLTSK